MKEILQLRKLVEVLNAQKNEAENLAKKLFPMTFLRYQLKDRLRKFVM